MPRGSKFSTEDRQLLAQIWNEHPLEFLPDIAARFAQRTGRSINIVTAREYLKQDGLDTNRLTTIKQARRDAIKQSLGNGKGLASAPLAQLVSADPTIYPVSDPHKYIKGVTPPLKPLIPQEPPRLPQEPLTPPHENQDVQPEIEALETILIILEALSAISRQRVLAMAIAWAGIPRKENPQ